jgi:hypothetical protein
VVEEELLGHLQIQLVDIQVDLVVVDIQMVEVLLALVQQELEIE